MCTTARALASGQTGRPRQTGKSGSLFWRLPGCPCCVANLHFACHSQFRWTGPIGPATTHRNSPIEALRYALEMLGKGYADVVIVDLTRKRQGVCASRVPRVSLGHEKA